MAEMFAALDTLPVPLVARVQGAALGGGTGLAAVCDIVVAEDDATFGFTEVRLGIVPAVIAPVRAREDRRGRGPRAVPDRRTVRRRSGPGRLGLVHAVVPAIELDSTVDGYLHDLLLGAPSAIARAKALIREVAGRAPADVRQRTSARDRRNSASRRRDRKACAAFLEKRQASWVRA